MRIFYDSSRRQWYQSSRETASFTFGGDKEPIAYHKYPKTAKPFSITLKTEKQHAGPLIGIMTARKSDGTITGNSSLFIKLQKKLLSYGGISFIFTPENVHQDHISGYIFSPDENGWKKFIIPFPDLVYNRVPFRLEEQSDHFQGVFSVLKRKGIPFFNPCFLNKYELSCLFQEHPILNHFLPKTELVSDKQIFHSFLTEHQCVYLKPSHSAKGKGIYRLMLHPSKELFLEGLTKSETHSSFQTFWEKWGKKLINKQYLVQEAIKSAQHEGKRFDFRILSHAEENHYIVTGVGIRQSQFQDLTTHIPNGGRLLPYSLFQTEAHDQFIKMAVNEIGDTLSQKFGYFGEFSIDAGISTSGNYYIYEVNSKPMSFDEIDIEEKKIFHLCRLFFQLTKFPFMHENSSNETN